MDGVIRHQRLVGFRFCVLRLMSVPWRAGNTQAEASGLGPRSGLEGAIAWLHPAHAVERISLELPIGTVSSVKDYHGQGPPRRCDQLR